MLKIVKCIKCQEKAYCSGLCKKHFADYFEKKIHRTIKKFNLFSKNDKIGVAASGGKDSTVCLYVLKKLGYNVEAIIIDAMIGSYTNKNLEKLRETCKKYNIRLHELSFKNEFGMPLSYIKKLADRKGLKYSSCFICGVLRRYLLNKYAKQKGFDCICTGHNLDDEAQAFMMNIFRNDLGLALRQGPISGVGSSKEFVKRAKPLYLCSEKETTAYSKLVRLPVNYADCPYREGAYRKEYADMLDKFEKKFPSTKYNIIQFFLRTIYKMKDSDLIVNKEARVNICQYCAEPCAKQVCKKCEILLALRE